MIAREEIAIDLLNVRFQPGATEIEGQIPRMCGDVPSSSPWRCSAAFNREVVGVDVTALSAHEVRQDDALLVNLRRTKLGLDVLDGAAEQRGESGLLDAENLGLSAREDVAEQVNFLGSKRLHLVGRQPGNMERRQSASVRRKNLRDTGSIGRCKRHFGFSPSCFASMLPAFLV